MANSMSLITAQITFLESSLVIIHIPIEFYPLFLQPILRILFGEDHDEDAAKIPWTNRHGFLNVSITPLECSIICTQQLADKYFVPLQRTLQQCTKTAGVINDFITIHDEIYIVIQVDGQGLEAGQRVLELTSPLAMAGIPIFFISTYFCDYILVPAKARKTVTIALEQRGFIFSKEEDAFISQLSPSAQHLQGRQRSPSSEECLAADFLTSSVPSTPPAKDVDELQFRTFKKLKSYGIKPLADDGIRLVSCAGSRERDMKKEERLKNDLLQVLISTPRGMTTEPYIANLALVDQDPSEEPDFSPSFLSLTINSFEPISILLEERLLPRLGKSLYGAKSADDVLVPITFDLSKLAFETSGIVGGVAGRLSHGKGRQGSYASESELSPTMAPVDKDSSATDISFLSTAKAGIVILKANQLEKALQSLNKAFEEIPIKHE